jgi:purine-binding chemotaxis protein CheW
MNQTVQETNQFLTFSLGDEVFALNIATVREVLEMTQITRIPRTPSYMRGVINLRGHAVPVVDLRRKFGMQQVEDTVETCIIIVEIDMDGEITYMGCVADSVREVLELNAEAIEPPPHMGTTISTEFIQGMGRQDEQFIIILDIDKVLSAEEIAEIQGFTDSRQAAQAAAQAGPAEEAEAAGPVKDQDQGPDQVTDQVTDQVADQGTGPQPQA